MEIGFDLSRTVRGDKRANVGAPNPLAASGVLLTGTMHEVAGRLEGNLLSVERDDARDFEARLADSSALAVRVAYGVLRNRHDAEDVAQEAFARAYRRFQSLRDRDRFRSWLVRMTWRLALDHRRAQKRRQGREDAVMAMTPQAGDLQADTAARERSARLWRAIDGLPDRLRVVIVLASIEGHGVNEVAGLLGVAEGTVKSRLFEARQKLREALQ
jgi:RNA polymerase sigma-70 factor (ECF subfamily)